MIYNDWVLLVGVRSLVWALDPLKGVPEGGVTLLLTEEGDQARIAAQVEMLEPELQPQLLSGGAEVLSTLPDGQRFDCVGGRLTGADLRDLDWVALWQAISDRCAPGVTLQLLTSEATAGPATALVKQEHHDVKTTLAPLLEREEQWLREQQSPRHQLEQIGWQIIETEWSETLRLPGGPDLEERWLAEGSAYRNVMTGLDRSQIERLRSLLRRSADKGMALPMRHQLLTGHFHGNKKSPGKAGAA